MSNKKQIAIYISFVLSLLVFSGVYFWFYGGASVASPLKYFGEKSFLTYHKNDLAIWFLEKSKERNSNDPETLFLLGRVYFVKGQFSKSIQNYTKSIELNPTNKESYYGRGLSFGFSGPIFYSNARADFQKYIDLDNENFEKTGKHAYGAWAGYNDLAWIYFLEGDFENSEKVARAGLELAPQIPWLQNMLGTALLAQKKCDEAKQYLIIAEETLANTKVETFGEAYSGDNPDFWEIGKKQMSEAIKENIKLCESM